MFFAAQLFFFFLNPYVQVFVGGKMLYQRNNSTWLWNVLVLYYLELVFSFHGLFDAASCDKELAVNGVEGWAKVPQLRLPLTCPQAGAIPPPTTPQRLRSVTGFGVACHPC